MGLFQLGRPGLAVFCFLTFFLYGLPMTPLTIDTTLIYEALKKIQG